MTDAKLAELSKKVADNNKALVSDHTATHALLKFYQLQRPGALDLSLVACALFVARVHQAPYENSFVLLCCMLADAHHQTNEVKWLMALDDAMSTGRFARVWPLLEELVSSKYNAALTELYTANKKKVDDLLRRDILVALSLPLSAIDTASLLVLTGAKGVAELAEVGKGVVDKAGDKEVTFVRSEANHPPAPQGPRALVTGDVAMLAKTIGVAM